MTRIRLSIIITMALATSIQPAAATVNPSDWIRYNIEERDPANEYPMGCKLVVRAQEHIQPIIYAGWYVVTPRTRTICNFFSREG